jgi:DNA-binding transcriptional MerR regulator
MSKAAEAFRTISEVAGELDVQKHVLRFWEARFPQVRPMKRGGGRRYYRPEDMELLRGIRHLLHAEGYTIKGVQKILREQGIDHVKQYGRAPAPEAARGASGKRARQAERAPAAPERPSARRGDDNRIRLPGSSRAPAGVGPEGRALLAAAIRELETCRKILLETAGKGQGGRGPRRARAIGA